MVRCDEFYREYLKKGNFCNKSDVIVRKVESYIEYMKRNKFNDFQISSNAMEPFIRIEYIKYGKVHNLALKELRKKIKKVGTRGITRRISIELINETNKLVDEIYKLDSIPEVRSRMGTYEHSIDNISGDIREQFYEFKKSIGADDNNETLKLLVEYCKDKISDIKEIKSLRDNCKIETVKER